jgi:hypothetical protein
MEGIGGAIGGLMTGIGEAFRELLSSIFGPLGAFISKISLYFASVYNYIPRNYVVGGLTILALGILLFIFVGRPRK